MSAENDDKHQDVVQVALQNAAAELWRERQLLMDLAVALTVPWRRAKLLEIGVRVGMLAAEQAAAEVSRRSSKRRTNP